MGFLKKLRDKAFHKDKKCKEPAEGSAYVLIPPGVDYTRVLDARENHHILAKIFSYVCPHAFDGRYEAIEHCVQDGCMLCDMRDLAACVVVKDIWHMIGVQIL
jgi:hypothetical protein